MDAHHFDALTKVLGQSRTRRTALGGMLMGLLVPLDAAARGKHRPRKGKGNGKPRDKQRAHAEAEPCWRAGACIPATGSNVSRCDLAGSTAFNGLNCTGCNVSRANLRGIDARNANFTKANLSGSCLVDADFTGATFASSTNLSNAIFCNTTMPNGSINNSGCGSGTACCPICSCTGVGQVCNAQGACVCAPGWTLLADGQCGYPCTNSEGDCRSIGCATGCLGNPGVCIGIISPQPCVDFSCPVGFICAGSVCLSLCGPAVGGPVAT